MIRSFAPGRVNLIGEHTDYTGGFVLPMAVDLGVTCTVTPRTDGRITATSAQMPGEVVEAVLADVAPGDVTGWGAYVIGTAWALREWGIALPGVDVHIDSTVPAGAGLSSSAAVECAVALALLAAAGASLPARDVARVAKLAENDFVGAPTGSMDQVASMLSQADALLFFDTGRDTTELVPFPLRDAGLHLLVVDTRAHHQLVTDEYGDRRRSLEQATLALGVDELREVTDVAVVEALADPVQRRRARHVVTENARVLETIELLRAGRITDIGPVLNAGHASLRDDLEVSCEELDVAVEAAVIAGALGSRMVGGGFGGSTIALVRSAELAAVREAVTQAFAARGFEAPRFYDVLPAQGAHLR